MLSKYFSFYVYPTQLFIIYISTTLNKPKVVKLRQNSLCRVKKPTWGLRSGLSLVEAKGISNLCAASQQNSWEIGTDDSCRAIFTTDKQPLSQGRGVCLWPLFAIVNTTFSAVSVREWPGYYVRRKIRAFSYVNKDKIERKKCL